MSRALFRGVAVSLLVAAAAMGSAGAAATPNAPGFRPTPPTVPPPQKVNAPDFLEGKPFPAVTPSARHLPAETRTVFVAAEGPPGDGSEARPWNDLQAALRALGPGDRLRVRAGRYVAPFRVDETCRDGTKTSPIQIVFDGKVTIEPGSASPGPMLTLARAHWLVAGGLMKLEDTDAAGVLIEGRTAHDVTLDGLRVSGGRGPSVRIGAEAARVSILRCNLAKSPVTQATPEAFGIEIEAGAEAVSIDQNRLHENPAGSVRVQAPSADIRPARGIRITGNHIYDDGATAIDVAAADDVAIHENVLSDRTAVPDTRGIALTRVRKAAVRFNRVMDYGVAIHLGHAEPDGSGAVPAEDVTVARNHLETSRADGTAIVIEAAARAAVANNLIAGYPNGILVFGKPPQTREVTVANNLLLGVSDVAFLLADPASSPLFDFNVFSSEVPPFAEIGGTRIMLARLLKEGKMPHSEWRRGVRFLNGDLGRITGVATVDRGTPVPGVPFQGAAPDIGIAEKGVPR